MKLDVEINADSTSIELPDDKGQMTIANQPADGDNVVWLYVKDNKLAGIQDAPKAKNVDGVITIAPAWDLEAEYLAKSISAYAVDQGIFKKDPLAQVRIPSSQQLPVTAFRGLIVTILNGLGFRSLFTPKKKFKGKPSHRFTKQVSMIAFHVNYEGARATVYWQKRNEMLIKAGAVMKPKPALNKDGSLGFSSRFAERLRSEHTGSFENFVTTKDIVLKSVNEVGLFLYFGGTNGWQILKDDAGKSIDEWTVAKE